MSTTPAPVAAHTPGFPLTASIGSRGASFHAENRASHPLSFEVGYRDPALSADGQAFAAEILRRCETQPQLLAVLHLIARGINTGAIRSQPIMDTSDPEAEEWPVKSLGEIVTAAILRAKESK